MLTRKDVNPIIQRRTALSFLKRLAGVRFAEIYDDAAGVARVYVVADNQRTPKQLLREILSALKSMGWSDLTADAISIVHMPVAMGWLGAARQVQIAGYSVSRGPQGITAFCRMSRGEQTFEASATAPTLLPAVAEAGLAAVNQIFQQSNLVHNHTGIVYSGEVQIVLVSLRNADWEIFAGTRPLTGPTEEAVLWAILDATNDWAQWMEKG